MLDRGTLGRYIAELSVTGPLLPADGEHCEAVIGEFARAGIDVDALAARLQEEGAASFAKSWNELLGVIEAKTSTPSRD